MSQTPPEWDARFPDRDQLRAEVRCLAACVRDQLLALIPADEIRGLYLKGSSVKAWESPLDYVPEVSDVDIHVWFRDDNSWRRHLDTVPQALKIQAGVEACFKDRIARPIHHPRLQLIVMGIRSWLSAKDSCTPRSPPSPCSMARPIRRPTTAIRTPSGAPTRPTSSKGPRGWSRCPCKSSISLGVYAREGLRQLVWRVAPVGPLVLHISGSRHRAGLVLEPDPSDSGATGSGIHESGGRLPCLLPGRLGLFPVRVH